MKRWVPILALIPFSLLLVVSLFLLTRPDPTPMSFASPMRPVPERQLTTLEGQPFSLPALKGRPYIVNFWGSYCAPCKLEHPHLVEMARVQNVEIVGILYEDPDIEAAKEILRRDGNPFSQIALDPGGEFGLDVGISGVPETFLVDANGIIIKTMRGPLATREMAQRFADAWREEKAKAPTP
jgi:cytochrome c biogenesis protein CcmG, thiol:disulfide interchange protein DsbE